MDTSVYADPTTLPNPSTIGGLIKELSKLDETTPIKILADHSILQTTIRGEDKILHKMHLEIDYSYVE